MAASCTQYGTLEVPGTTVQKSPSMVERDRVWPVAVCSLVACLSAFVFGIMLSFSSPTLAELAEETSPNRRLSANETLGSLFASFGTAGTALSSLLAWPLADTLGRKTTLMISGFPGFVGWLLIVYSAYVVDNWSGFVAILLVGRLLTGAAGGLSASVLTVYIGEIASKKWRGFFGNCNQLFVTLGVLFGFALGTINSVYGTFKYYHTALVAAGVIVLFEFLMLLPVTVESPRWLFQNGNTTKDGEREYLNILKFLRGKNAKLLIREDINDIKTSLTTHKLSLGELLKSFSSFNIAWPFFLVLLLVFFPQFSGITAAVFYSSEIFQQAHFDTLQSNLASLGAVGAVEFLGTLISVFLVDRLGRKTLLIVSSTGVVLSSAVMGVYFYVYEDLCFHCLGGTCAGPGICKDSNFGWLAIASMVVFIGSFSIGWGPITWTMLSELLPDTIRTLGGSVGTMCTCLWAIVITLSFEPYVNAVTPKFAWWSFSVVMIVSLFFVIFLLPETRGLALSDIQAQFKQKRVITVSCRCSRRAQFNSI